MLIKSFIFYVAELEHRDYICYLSILASGYIDTVLISGSRNEIAFKALKGQCHEIVSEMSPWTTVAQTVARSAKIAKILDAES
jgi:hypothetical protein